MTPNRRLIHSKTLFKRKMDGWYSAHIVAQGYALISEVEFTKNYSPVVAYVTLQI